MSDKEEPKSKKPRTEEKYELYYWPGVPGRGESIRLAFEETGTSYEDVVYTRGVNAVTALFRPKTEESKGECADEAATTSEDSKPKQLPHFAPPILKHGDLTISQTPNILLYLGPKLGLVPDDDGDRARVNQLFLTISDCQNEAHDVHHPISVNEYYEDQKDAALLRAKDFRANRIPKFFKHFESVLRWNSSTTKEGWLIGKRITYADLMLFHLVDGLKFAFPNTLEKLEKSGEYPLVFKLHELVKARPRIATYLQSKRRQAFGMGIYRHYEELDE